MSDLLSLIAEDKKKVSYRPSFCEMTGGVLQAILLSEIIYWWKEMGGPFYKFKQPCRHQDYKKGDSWCEALGFTRSEFDRALRGIGKKVRKAEKLPDECYVWFWTDQTRKTFYRLNEGYVEDKVRGAFGKAEISFTSLDNVEPDPEIDKNPSGSSLASPPQPQAVVDQRDAPKGEKPSAGSEEIDWPTSLVEHQASLKRIIRRVDQADRKAFLFDLAEAKSAGKIKDTTVQYAAGMIRNGWQPSTENREAEEAAALRANMEAVRKAYEGGAELLFDGEPVIPDPWPHLRRPGDGRRTMHLAEACKAGSRFQVVPAS